MVIKLKVYDSAFSYLLKESLQTIMELFEAKNQANAFTETEGVNDWCFVICFAVAVAFGLITAQLHIAT